MVIPTDRTMAVFSFVFTRPSWRACSLRSCLGWVIGDGSVATIVVSLCQNDMESNELIGKRDYRTNVWQDLRSYRYLFEADSEQFSRRTVLVLASLVRRQADANALLFYRPS